LEWDDGKSLSSSTGHGRAAPWLTVLQEKGVFGQPRRDLRPRTFPPSPPPPSPIRAHSGEAGRRSVRALSHCVRELSHCVRELSHCVRELSHCVHELSHYARELSHCVRELSHCVRELSHYASELSHCVRELSHCVRELWHCVRELSGCVRELSEPTHKLSGRVRHGLSGEPWERKTSFQAVGLRGLLTQGIGLRPQPKT